jgi:two-component system alkaline phosphatase synthesis response regulator PhoP
MRTILIIEDEIELARVLASYLQKADYSVLIENRGDNGLSAWKNRKPDLVILDLNLPGMDGLDVARAIRKEGETPIIMLTARVEETDRLIGLELGADDYVTKPFSPREVVARVKTVLKRSTATPVSVIKKIIIGELVIDIDSRQVTLKENEIDFTPSEFNILAELAGHPGRVYTRMQLLEAAQGNTFEGYERTIDVHVKNIRAKIETDSHDPQYIQTVFGVGYRFQRGGENS